MDVRKLFDIAAAVGLAADAAEFIGKVRTNAARAKHVLAAGDDAEMDAIHAEAMAANLALDRKLADAERR
jgi:hypothetical protein